jgi:hypothetical protein
LSFVLTLSQIAARFMGGPPRSRRARGTGLAELRVAALLGKGVCHRLGHVADHGVGRGGFLAPAPERIV